MAGGNRFTVNPFPDLVLTPEDRAHLIEIAHSIVIDKLEEYQEYIDNNKIVDLTRWRKYQSKGNTVTYIERKNSTLDCKFPASLMVGPLQGSLDENMFGLMSPTLESMRIKSSYLNDFHAGAVVATIVQPTVEEPFHSIIVKWMQIDIPGASTGFIHNRDYVYLEATGILRIHSGDRVGYHLWHSVNFPQTHELPHCIRGNMSICGMFLEEAPNRTFCRGTGVMDLKGGIPRALGIHGMVNATMTGSKYSHCAQMKKLAWLLEMKNAQRSERFTRAFKPECVTCKTKIKRLKSSNLGRRKNTCMLCLHALCCSCKIVRKLSFIAVDMEMEQRKMTFCSRCILKAAEIDTLEAARAQFVRNSSHTSNMYELPGQSSVDETSKSESTTSS
ncbi:hypothetical protein PsorP6_001191 [Peronosclerospora sorghi]|uniref:Uncharacterized protein n=1 Tax=Peronosclerospora sorghi TaxID=230839 RepID=A0ACC0WVK5_9STRA|nr:hypothetical protein PsorP6_001191 [Peronosclerospora sorghi]